jgi:hypothetical protein
MTLYYDCKSVIVYYTDQNIILTIAINKGFPLQIIHNLKNKLMLKTEQTKATPTQTQRKKRKGSPSYTSLLTHVSPIYLNKPTRT